MPLATTLAWKPGGSISPSGSAAGARVDEARIAANRRRDTDPMRVALLPIGYADGFRREASSGIGSGWVMIGGQPAPVLGRVSMNLTVVDVTSHTPPPEPGDPATLLGPGVTAHDHARWAGTIPYEILCGLHAHRRLA